MLLRDRIARDGEWLFRWRSYLPLVLAPVLIGAMLSFTYPGGSHQLDYAWEFLCFAVTAVGIAVRWYALGFAPPGTSGNTTSTPKAISLNTTGAYSLIRHPLYAGSFFMWLGIALFPRHGFVVIVVALAFWLYYERIMMAEEAFLRKKFPAEYAAWAARTPAVLPDFRNFTPPDHPFSFRRILRREYSGLFAVIAIFTILEVFGDYIVEGELEIEPFWAVFFAFGAVMYLSLWTIKHYTRWLRPAR